MWPVSRQVPLKVAAVELLKVMQDDGDEATAEAVRSKIESFPEVRTSQHQPIPLPHRVR
eukprot:COSAG01_NODE_9275_length_2496_cov_1.895286_6_plen_59_part_00